jgi:hypothetical protein
MYNVSATNHSRTTGVVIDSRRLRMRYAKLDGLLLTLLVLARVRIDTLAEAAVLPQRQQDVARHPLLGRLLSPGALELLAQQGFADPITLLLIVLALGALVAYLLLAFAPNQANRRVFRAKLALIWLIVILTVVAPSLKMALLRHESGPASYSHDGGVIQTEVTIEYLLSGRNPYREDYLGTPMAEWGLSEFRSALYHYPYLPWTFVFSAPFYQLSQVTLGWYDQRFVYLLLFAITLALAPGLVRERGSKLLLLMTLGLNPIMGSDVIFGQNDSFVLFWVVLALWLLVRSPGTSGDDLSTPHRLGAAAAFGLACASKPTAWFLAPFFVLLLSPPHRGPHQAGTGQKGRWTKFPWGHWLRGLLGSGWPALIVFTLLVLPYLVWDARALVDDLWLWSSGRGEHGYQIWGWGGSNLLLALGWVTSRFDYWPFWLPQLLAGGPLLVLLLRRQWRDNHIATACSAYALFLLVFFFLSRFLNENYLGYILAFVAIGTFGQEDVAREA